MLKKILFLVLIPVIVYANQSIDNDLKLVAVGNSGAAFRLGSRYLNGEGVEKDYEKARAFCQHKGQSIWFNLHSSFDGLFRLVRKAIPKRFQRSLLLYRLMEQML